MPQVEGLVLRLVAATREAHKLDITACSRCIISNINRLSVAERATIINLLVEGSSLRSISRVTGASVNTITKLLVDAGAACVAFHNETVRNVNAERVQVDEIWQFCYAKAKNVPTAKAAPEGAGDTWTSTALDADSKLIVSWLLGDRDGQAAYDFMMDLAERLASRVQLTSDGLRLYEGAVRTLSARTWTTPS